MINVKHKENQTVKEKLIHLTRKLKSGILPFKLWRCANKERGAHMTHGEKTCADIVWPLKEWEKKLSYVEAEEIPFA